MPSRASISGLLLFSTLMSGCGLNAVRVETAGNTSTLAATVASEAGAILADAQRRREQAILTLVASDPSCALRFPIYIFVPDGTPFGKTSPADVPLCADGKVGGASYTGYRREALDLSPKSQDAIKPTLLLIAAVSAYSEGLSKIVNSPKADIGKEIDDALALAQDARSQAIALGLKGIPEFPGLSDDQIKTAQALLQMIYDLDRERRQVKAISALYAKQGALLGTICPPAGVPEASDCQPHSGILPDLAQQVDNWANVVSVGSQQLNVGSLNRAYQRERNSLGFEGRRAFLTLVADAAKERERIDDSKIAFHESLVTLSQANNDLGRQLLKPSKEDREKAAVITRQRIVHALGLVLKAVAAWKGI